MPWPTILGVLVLLVTGLPTLLAQDVALIPQPQSLTVVPEQPGSELGSKLQVNVPQGRPLWREHVRVFGAALRLLHGCEVDFASSTANEAARLTLQFDRSYAAEEYLLSIEGNHVLVKASTIKGVSHATATLLQLFGKAGDRNLSQIEIRDQPGCRYRSFMVDLGRNPHSLECLKETIDLLWYYQLDSLQLHLTDDQRFAFPSKAFPKLLAEQGKITWQQFEELEQYAKVRGITLIPELDVPGHSTLLRKNYPEVFGETPTDVAKLPTSRAAIKVLLDEMMEVFSSSPFVHVGGDEAYGVPEALQRNLINDLHAHLKKQGKQTVVWEGPGLGTGANKVHKEVIHLNWRTINFPADKMLAAGYPVVNAAWDPLYVVDHYPRNNFTMASPEHIYKNMALLRFKHFNPEIRTFEKPIFVEPNDRLLGFCMPWWEGREVNFFPMVVPRVIPMAAIAWNAEQENDYEKFRQRSLSCEATRRRCFYPVTISASPSVLDREGVFHERTNVTLSATQVGELRYTLDGQEPTLASLRYQKPFLLEKSATVRAAIFVDGMQVNHGSRRTFIHVHPAENLALGKQVTASVTSGPLFSTARLTDGGTGNLDYFLGYPTEPEPILITIDLEEITSFNRVVTHAFFNNNAFEPYQIHVSRDGETYQQIVERLKKPEQLSASTIHDIPETQARYIRIVTHGCKGNVFDSFSRLTEIQVFSVTGPTETTEVTNE